MNNDGRDSILPGQLPTLFCKIKCNKEQAIVVGKYGDEEYSLVVLYPQVKTLDGELEAAILGWSGDFRAPSFAELMRQLSFMEASVDAVGLPVSQTKLVGSCAEKLRLNNVWWE